MASVKEGGSEEGGGSSAAARVGDERPLMRAGVEVRSTGNLRGMGTNNLQHRGGYLVS